MEGPIAVELGEYNESRQLFDEPRSPVECRKLFENYYDIAKRNFLNERSMYSYFTQCRTIADLPDVKRVLEIGPGGGITATLMRNIGYDYQTMDTQPQVNPDILCDFREFDPTEYEQAYDLVAAFQMLEHVPYGQFTSLVEKMKAVSRRWVLMSLPYYCWTFRLEIVLPRLRWLEAISPRRLRRAMERPLVFSISRPYKSAPNRKYRKEFMEEFPLAVHHWEIGRGSVTRKRLFNDLRSLGMRVERAFHSKVHPYHYFVLCERVG